MVTDQEMLFHFYRTPALPEGQKERLLITVRATVSSEIEKLETEFCFNVQTRDPLSEREVGLLSWLLGETFDADQFGGRSFFPKGGTCLEVGPRLSFKSAWWHECTGYLSHLWSWQSRTDRALAALPGGRCC